MNQELFDELVAMLRDCDQLKNHTVELIPTMRPNHGTCCTCQDCGHSNDADCVCSHNRWAKFLAKIR
jgi:hypothetical protein